MRTAYPDDPILTEMLQGPTLLNPQTGGAEAAPAPMSYATPQAGNVDPYGLSSYYEGGPSYMNLSQIPQESQNPVIEQMIGGMGFDPATLAAMRAGALEDVANAGLGQMGSMRRSLSAAGIGPQNIGGANYMANVARQTGDKQAQALQSININNAIQGNQNRQFGLNLAHQVAVENANRLFQGMGQNLQESGANTRTATGLLMGQNPFNPGSGNPQQSGIGPAITGAANNINWGSVFGGKQPMANNPPTASTPPFAGPDLSGGAFSKNPFKGY